MSRSNRKSFESADELEIFSDQEFELSDFVSSMEKEDVRRSDRERTSRQKLEDLQEAQWLRSQLHDWDDLDKDDK